MRKFALVFIGVLGLILLVVFVSNYTIEKYAVGKTYNQVEQVPKQRVGLVLGTSKYGRSGNVNLYFLHRVNATVELYKNGKIDFVLVSGDNGKSNYDEPSDFKEALLKKGIPASRIYLDYAGFRTLDSVIRAKKVFGLKSFVVISQQFHNERAIYIAQKNGIKAIGYNAKAVRGKLGMKVKLREVVARVKVFIDLLFGVGPRFLGDPISID